jgi:hypothetical protein
MCEGENSTLAADTGGTSAFRAAEKLFRACRADHVKRCDAVKRWRIAACSTAPGTHVGKLGRTNCSSGYRCVHAPRREPSRSCGRVTAQLDLAAVVDPRCTHKGCRWDDGSSLELAAHAARGGVVALRVRACPDCVLFLGAVPPREQAALAAAALAEFPDAPAATNHTARYGALRGLWGAAQRSRVLRKVPPHSEQCEDEASGDATSARPALCQWQWALLQPEDLDKTGQPRPDLATASRLTQKLRWASIGPRYGARWPLHMCSLLHFFPPFLLHQAQCASSATLRSARQA